MFLPAYDSLVCKKVLVGYSPVAVVHLKEQ